MKYNMGCGSNFLDGYTNVDKFPTFSPDLMFDLECFPWPIFSNSADEVVFHHCLEHLGQETDVFLEIVRELYRICKNQSKVIITVPHPRHEHFLGDPTHVRIINQNVLSLFSKKLNREWKKAGASNTPLATYLDVDFEVIEQINLIDPRIVRKIEAGLIDSTELDNLIIERNNIIQECKYTLLAIKQA